MANTGRKQQKQTIEVRVRINVVRIIDVDTTKQEFKAKGFLEASWMDPAIRNSEREHVDGSQSGSNIYIVDLEKTSQRNGNLFLVPPNEEIENQPHFTPRLEIRNEVESHESLEWFEIFENLAWEGPVVCYRLRFLSTFQFSADLHEFPFDIQRLPIELVSFWSVKDAERPPFYKVNLIKNIRGEYRSVVNVSNFTKSAEYRLHRGIVFEGGSTRPEDSASKHRYPMLRIVMIVERRVGFWGFNVVLPMFMISNSAFAGYAIPIGDYPNRLGNSVTVLLTMVAFKFVVAGALPSINYLTLVDKYVLACFFMTFFIIVEQFAVVISEHNYAQPWVKCLVFCGSWNLGHLYPIRKIQQIRSQRKQDPSASAIITDSVWIGKLKPGTNEQQVQTELGNFGKVTGCRIWTSIAAYEYTCKAGLQQLYPMPQKGNEDSLFAVVRFEDEEAAHSAVTAFEYRSDDHGSNFPEWFSENASVEFLDHHWRCLGNKDTSTIRLKKQIVPA